MLYEKEDILIEDADKILTRIEHDEVMILTFEKLLELIKECQQLHPNVRDNYFRFPERCPDNDTIYTDTNETLCNEVDEYLYNSITSKYSDKVQNTKELSKTMVLERCSF
jgi:hypothetical protein